MTRSSFPDDRDTLTRDFGPLFAAPEPPSGPQTAPLPRKKDRLAAYRAWRRSEEGGRVFGWIITEARRQMHDGEKRVSTKALVEACRGKLKVEIDNSYTSLLADSLVDADARLLDVVERRVRKARV